LLLFLKKAKWTLKYFFAIHFLSAIWHWRYHLFKNPLTFLRKCVLLRVLRYDNVCYCEFFYLVNILVILKSVLLRVSTVIRRITFCKFCISLKVMIDKAPLSQGVRSGRSELTLHVACPKQLLIELCRLFSVIWVTERNVLSNWKNKQKIMPKIYCLTSA